MSSYRVVASELSRARDLRPLVEPHLALAIRGPTHEVHDPACVAARSQQADEPDGATVQVDGHRDRLPGRGSAAEVAFREAQFGSGLATPAGVDRIKLREEPVLF